MSNTAEDSFLPAVVGRVFRSFAERFDFPGMEESSEDMSKKDTPIGG